MMLDGLKVVQVGDVIVTRDVNVYGTNPAWTRNLRTFGETGEVIDTKNAKTGNRRTVMMFVGYPENREHDSVRIWNPKANVIWTSRDVIWPKNFILIVSKTMTLFCSSITEKPKKKTLVLIHKKSLIRILIILLCINPAWTCKVEDVEGAFLQGTFNNGEVIYCEVPDGMEEFYGTRASTVLRMLVPLYGTKQMLLPETCGE
jgi:hypothetical protein